MDLAILQQQQQQKQFNQSQFNQLQSNNFINHENQHGHFKQMSQPAVMQPHIQQQHPQQQQQHQQTYHRPSRSVVHVRENSLDELDALFDPTKWINRKTNNLPLSKRNLPQSFFKPPETGGTKTPKLINSNQHSRQNSIDQTNVLNHSNLLNQQHLLLQQKLNNLNGAQSLNGNFHSRSISEPVAAALSPFSQQQQQLGQQFNQTNQVNTTKLNQVNQQLPYGWRAAKTQTGQRYYINYLTKQTSWTLPTQQQSNSFFDQQQQQHNDNFISSSSSASSSPVLNNLNNQQDNDITMMNSHLNIETKSDCNQTNNLNSMSSTVSSSTSASVSASDDDLIADFQQNQQFELQQQLEKLENQQQLELLLNQIPMPNGWERAQTAKGEIYFINHNNKSTYWEDPRLALIPNFLKQQKLKTNLNQQQQRTQLDQTLISVSTNPNVSPLYMNTNSTNNLYTTATNSTANLQNETVETLNDLNYGQQANHSDIKTLIVEVINKKKELFKSLEDLNKQVRTFNLSIYFCKS